LNSVSGGQEFQTSATISTMGKRFNLVVTSGLFSLPTKALQIVNTDYNRSNKTSVTKRKILVSLEFGLPSMAMPHI
jgi:hypothetical protein